MENVFTLNDEYLAAKREEIKNDIAYAKYEVGGVWYRAEIRSVEVAADGHVEATFIIDYTASGNDTVTGIELYDQKDALIGKKTLSITRPDEIENILYSCRFNLFQVVENTGGTGAFDALQD